MISRTYFTETFYDMDVEIAQRFAQAIREAWMTGKDFEGEKKPGFFLSKNRGFDDKLYVGNIHRIENHLYWNDEELTDDDEIVNVVVIDGPVTRDGDGCSYGSKDHRDQILYANTIPQVKGHIFIINTPGGAASARIDYEQAIADCREKGKPTVAWVDGMCASAGQLVASLCDRTIVMNGRDTMGCIGTMCAFWAVPHNTVDQDGYRYIELVSVTSPDKNAEYREAADGKTEKLQAELDRLGEEFRETVRQNRPLVKEEHLTGKTFDADEVMGALVDEVGDYNRAIQAVFELADGTLTAARNAVIVSDDPAAGGEPEEQKDLATLNEQQKAAIAKSEGDLMMAENGHVTTEKQGFFGPETVEVATPKNDTIMTEEEKKAAEVAEQPATTQEALSNSPEGGAQPATEQPAEEETHSNSPEGGEQSTEAPASEETAAPSNSPEGDEQGQEEAAGQAEALATAEALVAERDKEIAELKESLATLNGIAQERDNANATIAERETAIETLNAEKEELTTQRSTLNAQLAEHVAIIAAKDAALTEKDARIEALQKKVADLQAEVKELSEKPAPMTNADAGVPAGNGTGEAPKVNQHQRVKPGMTYKEIRALKKAEKA